MRSLIRSDALQSGDVPPPSKDLQSGDVPPLSKDLQSGDVPPPSKDVQSGDVPPPSKDLQSGDVPPPSKDVQSGDVPQPSMDLQSDVQQPSMDLQSGDASWSGIGSGELDTINDPLLHPHQSPRSLDTLQPEDAIHLLDASKSASVEPLHQDEGNHSQHSTKLNKSTVEHTSNLLDSGRHRALSPTPFSSLDTSPPSESAQFSNFQLAQGNLDQVEGVEDAEEDELIILSSPEDDDELDPPISSKIRRFR